MKKFKNFKKMNVLLVLVSGGSLILLIKFLVDNKLENYYVKGYNKCFDDYLTGIKSYYKVETLTELWDEILKQTT